MSNNNVQLQLDSATQLVTTNDSSPTVSVLWDRAVQQAVILDNGDATTSGPTIASRAYGLLHTAMFDAWSAYNLAAAGVNFNTSDEFQRSTSENTDANKTEAMSYAAYNALIALFTPGGGTIATDIQAVFDGVMSSLNLDPANTSTDTNTAAGIGNAAANALIAARITTDDGSNQAGGFADTTNYVNNRLTNPDSSTINDIELWTPENVSIDSSPGDANFVRQQSFLTPQWGLVNSFAIDQDGDGDNDDLRPVAPEAFFLDTSLITSFDVATGIIVLTDGTKRDLIAGNILAADNSVTGTIDFNTFVGTDTAAGAIINAGFITQAQEVVDVSAGLSDQEKLIAEFWEDSGETSFPPGTWMTFGQYVSARDDNSIDDDALLFFALGNAVFDAGVATWEAKEFYNYVRPVRAIRELGRLGLLNNRATGIDELTNETGFVIRAWGGPDQGTKTILAENFLTYQTPGGDPSPPFGEYTSGHSAFSAAGAAILQSFTGSNDFGASVTFAPNSSRFEPNSTPSLTEVLSWATFTQASDEAGISRIYGGIHFEDGDLNGRQLGRDVGSAVWTRAQTFANNSAILNYDFSLNTFSTTSEIGFVIVDDASGAIDGLAESAGGYNAAALAQSSVLFSAFSTITDVTVAFNPLSTRSFLDGSFVRFFTVENGTVDSLINSNTGAIAFSSVQQLSTTTTLNLDIGGVTLTGSQNTGTVEAGIGFQGIAEAEVLDLTGFDNDVTATITVQRESDFDNLVGFYIVDDFNGTVTNNGTSFAAGSTGYTAAALARRLQNVNLSASDDSSSVFTVTLQAGQVIAPFLIANGTVEQLLDNDANNNPEIFFSYAAANSDGFDHVRLFANNIFGFEDLVGGGDQDFDDLIVAVDLA